MKASATGTIAGSSETSSTASHDCPRFFGPTAAISRSSAGAPPSTALAYVDARDRLAKWLTDEVICPPLLQRWNRRLNLLGEDPLGDPHRPSAFRIELVTYPEAVVLTRLFASPHWRGHSHLSAEAARRLGIAPDQMPSSTSP
ncbi:hypothetical protein [Streptomyces sp. NPDC056669]|uniref:hypothetical protein n=1 Tax=unclassified Streptomyces TaxID=2593676 RepID=UPI0036BEF16A